MPLTMDAIRRVTPRVVVDNAEYVRILEGKKTFTRTEGVVRVTAKVRTSSSFDGKEHKIHRVIVENVNPGDTTLGSAKIRVSCTCRFFQWYGCGDVLYARGAGFRQNVTGIMPDERNPNYVPFCCKHLIRVFANIKKKGL